MAGKTIQGLSGSVTNPSGFNFKVSAFSATHNIENVDTSGFEDGGFRTFEPTITSMSGSISGTAVYDAADSGPIPAGLADGSVMTGTDLDAAKASLTLTAITGCTFTGTAVVSNVAFNRAVDGKCDVTLDFVFTGPFTMTWDSTS